MFPRLYLFMLVLVSSCSLMAQPRFRVLALVENSGHHIAYSTAAKVWLNKLAADSNFTIDYIDNTNKIDSAFLLGYKLFIQLDYPPYAWKPAAVISRAIPGRGA